MGAPVLTARDAATRQVPAPGGLVLDHVAHFLPDIEAASRDLARMGFALLEKAHTKTVSTIILTQYRFGAVEHCGRLEAGTDERLFEIFFFKLRRYCKAGSRACHCYLLLG